VSGAGFPRLFELDRRSVRDELGVVLVEGARFVARALDTRAEIVELVTAPALLCGAFARKLVHALHKKGVPLRQLSAEQFRALSRAEEPQGIAAVVRQRWSELPEGSGRRDLWLAVESIRSPGNLGTMLRTCDAVGARGLICLGYAIDPHDPRAVRGSMGALFDVKLVRATHAELARWCRRERALVVGTSARATRDFRAQAYPGRIVLMIGAERGGMSEAQENLCDAVVRIPMFGRADSLNVAVAVGILAYEITLRRSARGSRRCPPDPRSENRARARAK
jgi:TrmH family RNA methyltransferase